MPVNTTSFRLLDREFYPTAKFFNNNKTALQNSKLVEEAILDLLRYGRIRETSDPPFVLNPLTVSENSSGKKRLILDLRYINQFVWKQKFKLDDWKTMTQYVRKGSFMFSFDLRHGPFRRSSNVWKTMTQYVRKGSFMFSFDLRHGPFRRSSNVYGVFFSCWRLSPILLLYCFMFWVDLWSLHIYQITTTPCQTLERSRYSDCCFS